MSDIAILLSILGGGGILGILGALLKLAYNMGIIAKEINTNTEITGKIFEKVTTQDKSIDFLSTTKADKEDVTKLKDEFIELRTEHNICFNRQAKKEVE